MGRIQQWGGALGIAVLVGSSQAALVDRGGGMVYDTTRNLTWLTDMNHAHTSGYAAANAGGAGANLVLADGRMGGDAAKAWADNLVHGGYTDWRLPSINPSDTSCSESADPGGGFPIKYFGYHCTGGELSGLFVTDLGNKGGETVLNQAGDTAEQIANLALFSNVSGNQDWGGYYWSGTQDLPFPTDSWVFFNGNGGQYTADRSKFTFFATAVRTGDVASRLPEPQSWALALLALAATAAARKRPQR